MSKEAEKSAAIAAKAQAAWGAFKSGDVDKADKLAKDVLKSGVPLAHSVTRKIHEVLGAAVAAGAAAAKK